MTSEYRLGSSIYASWFKILSIIILIDCSKKLGKIVEGVGEHICGRHCLPLQTAQRLMAPAIDGYADCSDSKRALSIISFKHVGFELIDDLFEMDERPSSSKPRRAKTLSLLALYELALPPRFQKCAATCKCGEYAEAYCERIRIEELGAVWLGRVG